MTAPSFSTTAPAANMGPPPAPHTVDPLPSTGPQSSPEPRAARAPLLVDLATLTLVLVGVGLSAFAWRTIFADLGFMWPMMGVSVVVGAVVMVARRRGWSPPASFLAMIAVAVLGLAVRHGTDVADLPSNLVEGWKGLASTGLLIPTEPRFLVAPIFISAIGTWGAAEAMIRRRSSPVAILALLAVHTGATAYCSSQWQPTWWFAAVLAAVLCLLLAVAGLTRPGGAAFADGGVDVPLRQLASTVMVVGALVAVAGGSLLLIGARSDRSFDLREHLVRPLDISESATPLARVKAGLVDEDNSTVFTVSAAGLGADEAINLLPVAVLDRYDGTIWSTTARFEVAGSRLPEPVLPNPSSGDVAVSVTLTDRYPFRFLPQLGVTRQVVEGDLAWDPVTGTVATIDSAAGGYRALVAPIVPTELPEALGDTDVSLANVGARADLTDEQRVSMNAYLAEVVEPDADPLDQLRSVQADLLSDRFGYNENAPAGHSLAALTSYLWPVPTEGEPSGASAPTAAGRVGFSEHAAASFAVLAREVGVPSRVVVGYLLTEPITADTPEVLVTENMIHAWPELWIDGVGWIRVEVTNKVNQSPEEPDRTPAVSAAGVEANASDLPDVEEPVILPDEDLSTERSSLWWLLLVPLLPLVYLAVVVAAKWLRRSRRRRRSADERIIGAWRETRDRFGELGLPSSPSLSALDVAEELDLIDLRQVGDPLVALAPRLDTALYAPVAATEADAERAWTDAAAAVSQARKAASLRAKVRAAFDPRALISR